MDVQCSARPAVFLSQHFAAAAAGLGQRQKAGLRPGEAILRQKSPNAA